MPFLVIFQMLILILGMQILYDFKIQKKTWILMVLPSIGITYFIFGILGASSMLVFIIFYIACLFWQTKEPVISITLPSSALLFSLIANYVVEAILVVIPMDFSFEIQFALYIIISSIVIISLNFIARKIFVKLNLSRFIDKRYAWSLIIFLMLLTVYIYFNITIMQQTGTMDSILGLLLVGGNALILLVMLLITIFIASKSIESEFEREQALQLKEYTMELEGQYTGIRKFKHDYLNILKTFESFIIEEDFSGLSRHYWSEISPTRNQISAESLQLENLSNIKNLAVKGILFNKVNQALLLKINTVVEVPTAVKNTVIKDLDLCVMLGIIMDNAIQESVYCDVPKINVGVIDTEESCLIVIDNTCRATTPTIRQMQKEGFSIKGNGRGSGLPKLNELIAKYSDKVSLDTILENGIFAQKITIIKTEVK